MNLQRRVSKAIDEYGPLRAGQGVLVAVSGGVDSVVLLHLLHSLAKSRSWRLQVGHVNHRMRAEESDKDESFVRELAAGLDLPFHFARLDRSQWAQSGNNQARARKLRLGLLERWAAENSCSMIATAHHADDQAETLIERLSRGAGMDGLSGIAPRRGRYLRPLLFATRDQIEDYARKKELSWREDASNESSKYRRNRIRHEALTVLEDIVGGAKIRIAEAAGRIREADDALRHVACMEARKRSAKTESGSTLFDLSDIDKMPVGLRKAIWRETLRVCLGSESLWRFDARHLERIDEMALSGDASRRSFPRGIALWVGEGRLNVEKTGEKKGAFDLPLPLFSTVEVEHGKISCRRIERENHPMPTGKYEIAVDEQALSGPLRIRSRIRGDRILIPNVGSRRVSRAMSDAKLPLALRESWPLVVAEDEVVWIPGIRRSSIGWIDDSTSKIIGIKFARKVSK